MTEQVKWKNLQTGIIFTIGLFFTGLLALVIGKNTSFTSTKSHYTMFSKDIQGLAVANLVAVAGKKVGVVSKMDFERRDGAIGVKIELEIVTDYAYLITDDALAIIKSQGVLGDKYVDIIPGNGKLLNEGEELLVFSEPGLPDLMNSARFMIDSLRMTFGKINRGEGTIGQLLITNDPLVRLNRTLNNIEKLSSDLAYGKGPLRMLMTDAEMAQNIKETTASLKEIAESLKNGNGTAGKLIKDEALYNNLNSSLKRLDSLMAEIQNPNGTVGKLLKDPKLYDNLTQTVTSLDSLLVDLKRNPSKYVQFKFF
ncbi:MAG: MlaD family protein [Chloroherpetonaceae bacterium]|nr:MlaD family protein [Chloroherpetonaceae bacterium]